MNKKVIAKEIYKLSGIDLNADLNGVDNILHIGCGNNKLKKAVGVDVLNLPEVDVIHDLDSVPWPFADVSFDFVFAHNVFEHLSNIPSIMQEIARILKPSGRLVVTVPYFRHIDAITDPTHKHMFTSRSFEYFVKTGEGLRGYSYTKISFKKIGFWYGWPHAPKNIFKRLLKRSMLRSPQIYDQYLSYIFPVKILIWEFEKK